MMANLFSYCFPTTIVSLVVIVITSYFHEIQCSEEDRSLLLRLKHEISIDHDEYASRSRDSPTPIPPPKVWSWNGTGNHEDCCLWEGVTCDSYSGQVVGLDLSSSFINGGVDDSSSIFHLRDLQRLSLADNHMNTSVTLFPSSFDNLSGLTHLNLSKTGFSGPLPLLLASSNSIRVLDLSSNNFDGTIPVSYSSSQFPYLETLSLTNNDLRGKIPRSLFSKPSLYKLALGSNQLEGQLEELHNPSSKLREIDLSRNKLRGNIPLSFFNITTLVSLSVASNDFSGRINLVNVANIADLKLLDLSDNHFRVEVSGGEHMLSGILALKLRSCNIDTFPDFSSGNYESLGYLDLSRNKITGNISPSICDLRALEILDLSNNRLDGLIPPCLTSLPSIHVLSLRNNQLSGMLPEGFTPNCTLRTLDVNQNHLRDQLPESLSLCKGLEAIDVGKNYLTGQFPTWLENLPLLRILILRSNQFDETIDSRNMDAFSQLQIFDVSSNKFVGKLPSWWFISWKTMKKPPYSREAMHSTYSSRSNASVTPLFEEYYQNSVTVTKGGIELEFIRILTFLILVDVSNNRFTDEIPEAIANLKSLRLLNLSNNHFTGRIPESFGQLSSLESLDLSSNKLSGYIPTKLSELIFLEYLNLSRNVLTGEIPRGRQFDTFEAESYQGNPGLCGLPLPKSCNNNVESTSMSTGSKADAQDKELWHDLINWEYYRVGVACGGGTGLVAGFVVAYLAF